MFSLCEKPWECLASPTMLKYVSYYSFIKYYSGLYAKVCGMWVYAPLAECGDTVCKKALKAICAKRYEVLEELWPELSKRLGAAQHRGRRGRIVELFKEVCESDPLRCITRNAAAVALGVSPNTLIAWVPEEFVNVGTVSIYKPLLRVIEEEVLALVDRKYVSASYIGRKVGCSKPAFLSVISEILGKYAEGIDEKKKVTYYYFSQPPGKGKRIKPKALLALCRVSQRLQTASIEDAVEEVCTDDPVKCATLKDALRLLRMKMGRRLDNGARRKILNYFERVGHYYIYKPYKERLEALIREIAEKNGGWACSKAIREAAKSWKQFALAIAVARSMAVDQRKRRNSVCYRIAIPLATSR